jgi:hypothetical protein
MQQLCKVIVLVFQIPLSFALLNIFVLEKYRELPDEAGDGISVDPVTDYESQLNGWNQVSVHIRRPISITFSLL